MTTEPVKLSDAQMDAVLAAAHPLQPHRRSAFLADVAREISRQPVLGDGLLFQLVTLIQRRHFDPPSFAADSGASRSRRASLRIEGDEVEPPRRRSAG